MRDTSSWLELIRDWIACGDEDARTAAMACCRGRAASAGGVWNDVADYLALAHHDALADETSPPGNLEGKLDEDERKMLELIELYRWAMCAEAADRYAGTTRIQVLQAARAAAGKAAALAAEFDALGVVAACWFLEARAFQELGEFDQARAAYERTLQLRRELMQRLPGRYGVPFALTLAAFGQLERRLGDEKHGCDLLAEAVEQYRQHADLGFARSRATLATMCNSLANACADLNELDAASASYQQALELREELARRQPDEFEPLAADVLVNLGILSGDREEHHSAQTFYERAIAIYEVHLHRQSAFAKRLATALTNLGVTQRALRDWAGAAESYGRARELLRQLSAESPGRYDEQLATVLNNLGNLQMRRNALTVAKQTYEESLAIFKRLAETHPDLHLADIAMVHGNLGALLCATGDSDDARGYLEAALQTLEPLAERTPLKYRDEWLRVLNNLGAVQRAVNDLEAAKTSFEAVLAARRAAEQESLAERGADVSRARAPVLRDSVAGSLINLGLVCHDLREFDAARKCFVEATARRRQLAASEPEAFLPDLAAALTSLGTVLSNTSEQEEAVSCYREAIDIYRRLADKNPEVYQPLLVRPLNDLGAVWFERGDREQATQYFSESLRICQALHMRQAELNGGELARAYVNAGAAAADDNCGRQYFEAAAKLYETESQRLPTAFLEERIICWSNLGRLIRRCAAGPAELASAREALRQAKHCAELFRGRFRDARQRRRVQSEAIQVYEQLLLTCIDEANLTPAARLQEAVEVAEAGRARNLNELIGYERPPSQQVPAELWNEFRQAHRRLVAAEDVLRRSADFEYVAESSLSHSAPVAIRVAPVPSLAANEQLRNRVRRCQRDKDRIVKRVCSLVPTFDPNRSVPPLSFDAIRDLIPTDVPTAIIQLSITQELALAIVITRDELFAVPLPAWCDEYARQTASRWLNHLPHRVRSEMPRDLRPAQNVDSAHPVWLEVLDQLSREVLGSVLREMAGRGLQVKRLGATENSQEEPRQIRRLILSPHRVFHLFPFHACRIEDGGYLADACEVIYAPSLSILAQCAARASTNDRSLLLVENPTSDLPFAAVEGAALRSLYRRHTVLSGSDARRERLLGDLRCGVFHYAGHALFQLQRPERSALVLVDRDDDRHWLTLADALSTLTLTGNALAVINGCESGLVQPSQVDEYTGLAAGFLYAGAPCVINTLWPVSDLSSALLMYDFHRRWLSGQTAAAALRQSQLWLRDDVTSEALKSELLPDLLADLDDDRLAQICLEQARSYITDENDDRVFSSPVHWAPFQAVGHVPQQSYHDAIIDSCQAS